MRNQVVVGLATCEGKSFFNPNLMI